MLLMGLRLAEGIDLDRYRGIAGRTLDPSRSPISSATAWSSARATAGSAPPAPAFFVLDAVVADLAA